MALTYAELVARARAAVREIEPDELVPEAVLLLDVREPHEHAQGSIAGARLVPRGLLEGSMTGVDPTRPIVLYCAGDARAVLAAKSLQDMGFGDVAALRGGFDRWKSEGRDWEVPRHLDAEQQVRYSRHLLLPEVGAAGQARLLRARVLVVGAGGLGSAAALYLAAAGVGTLGIVDHDVVDLPNLQRQVLHTIDRLGRPKVESAQETLAAINPEVKVDTYRERLVAGNALRIMDGYDLVVDGGDNFPVRYLVNDAALHLRLPVVHGSILRFEGQLAVFRPYDGPCYRCLFPAPPPAELAPSCSDAGVLGAVAGVVGSLQAVEAIKLLLEIGEPLTGRLLAYDGLAQEWQSFTARRSPTCPACSDPDRPPLLVDYDPACRPAGTVARRS